MNKQVLGTVGAFLFGFLAIIAGLYVYQHRSAVEAPADVPGLLWPNPIQITDFSLTDLNAQPFDLARVRGKWTMWYFGYTNCPDACPLAMTVMTGVDNSLREADADANDVQFAFVSLDPARDTLEHIGNYVRFFSPDFIAATGPEEDLPTIIRQFGVLRNLQTPDEDGNYFVDHTTALLLTDPQARFVGIFQQPHEVADITRQFRLMRSFIEAL